MTRIRRAPSNRRRSLLLAGRIASIAALLALAPGLASATPERFSFSSGSASLTADLGGIRLNDSAAIADMTGSFVEMEFDAASGGPALVDFEFVLGEATLTFDSPVAGVTALVLESTTIRPDDSFYMSPPGSDLGDGEVAVGGGPVEFDVTYRLETTDGPTSARSATLMSPGITANVDVDGGTLSLLGSSLAVILPSKDLLSPLVLKADLVFRGASKKDPGGVVPEPTGALLLSVGLVVSAHAVRRRREADRG